MRNRYLLIADLPLIATAAFGAFALRFDWLFASYRPEFFSFLIAALLAKPLVYLLFGMYSRYWRYATTNDLMLVVMAVSAASVVLATYVGVGRTLGFVGDFSRPVLLIDWLLSLLLAGGVRLSVRLISEATSVKRNRTGEARRKTVLVVGAGDAGAMVVREMQRNPQLELQPVGFLDDDQRKLGKRIYGQAVVGNISALERVARVAAVDEVIIAMPKAPGAVLRTITERCRTIGIPCRTIPGVFELLNDQVSVSRLRQVDIADLLRRNQVDLNTRTQLYLDGRTILITGAGGSIGSELARQVAHAGPARLILLGHGENSVFEIASELSGLFPNVKMSCVIADVRDGARLKAVFLRERPDVVFHAAAHKHVPLMEDNPQEALTNNVFGTKNVVDAAVAANVSRLVMISTDKAVAPSSIMGASKRMAEFVVRDAARRTHRAFVVVRFGNVLGSRGSVVPVFKRQILEGGPITITHPDMRRFFMTIPEAVHLVIQAGGHGKGGELFVLNMGEPVRIVDLARDLIRLSGFEPDDVQLVFTGLRPGEKLEECLWEDGAVVESGDSPDLLKIVEPNEPTPDALRAMLHRLEAAAAAEDNFEIQAALATCIDTFTPPMVLPTTVARPPVA